jgi:uncharacterized Tic20 family protein
MAIVLTRVQERISITHSYLDNMEQQPTPSAENQASPPATTPNSNDRTLAVLAHIGGLLFGFVPALVIWLVKKDESPYLDRQGKEALNFQIFIAICVVASMILMIIVIGVLLLIATGVVNLIFCIIAAVRVSNGADYRYPLTIRLIK